MKMPLTQPFILRSDSGSTVVQMAQAQVLAAQSHHRAGTERKTVSPKDSAFDHVQTRFQTTVYLQADALPQAIFDQCVVAFSQAGFPW